MTPHVQQLRPIELLKDTWNIISPIQNWTQGADARDQSGTSWARYRYGNEVEIMDPNAKSWCAAAATYKALHCPDAVTQWQYGLHRKYTEEHRLEALRSLMREVAEDKMPDGDSQLLARYQDSVNYDDVQDLFIRTIYAEEMNAYLGGRHYEQELRTFIRKLSRATRIVRRLDSHWNLGRWVTVGGDYNNAIRYRVPMRGEVYKKEAHSIFSVMYYSLSRDGGILQISENDAIGLGTMYFGLSTKLASVLYTVTENEAYCRNPESFWSRLRVRILNVTAGNSPHVNSPYHDNGAFDENPFLDPMTGRKWGHD